MPVEVRYLKRGMQDKIFLRGQVLDFLKKNSRYAYTLNELYEFFLKRDIHSERKYISKKNVLYHLIYGYLREFIKNKKVMKEGNFYYYNEKKN